MDESIRESVTMQLAVEPTSRTPAYRQIEAQLRALILAGHLPQGARLPSERLLARHLGVNRTTVVSAYRELSADGLIEGRVGNGTIVLGPPTPLAAAPTPAVPLAWTGLLQPRLRAIQSPLVRHVADLVAQPGIISFATGVPEAASSPHLHLEQVTQRVLASHQQSLLQDSPTAGLLPLRSALARRLALQGLRAPSPNQVFVVSGSQQGLYLVAQLLLDPGDAVLVESPTYLGALEVFRAIGARLIEVPVDDHGLQVEALERILAHAHVRLIYTIPNFQNPTGSTQSVERRRQLLALAQRFQVPILEDDPYGELFYEAAPPAPIRAMDDQGCVLYLGSLSPVLGPGLRLGWLVVPTAVVEPLTTLRQAVDLHPNSLVQQVVHELLADGSLDAHLAWVRREYALRRDAMLAALQELMPTVVHCNRPQGGFYLWCSLAEPFSSRELLEQSAAEGVVFLPGEVFFASGYDSRSFRLSFAHSSLEEIHEGVGRLARAAKKLEKRGLRPLHAGDAERPVV